MIKLIKATNITTFTQNRIHLPASLVPASFSPPPIKNSAYPPTNQIPGLCQSNDGQSASTFVKNEVAKARSETAAKLKSGRTKPIDTRWRQRNLQKSLLTIILLMKTIKLIQKVAIHQVKATHVHHTQKTTSEPSNNQRNELIT